MPTAKLPMAEQVMSHSNGKKVTRKEKLVGEMKAYFLNVAYLFLFLGMFAMYRRLILAHYEISYLNYGVSLAEALVLAKVIMLGDVLRLARGWENRPLIVPTLYKTVLFSLLVGAFTIVEHMFIGRVRGKSLAHSFEEITGKNSYELLARCLVSFFSFIPFFSLRELGRVLGRGKLAELFFHRTTGQLELN